MKSCKKLILKLKQKVTKQSAGFAIAALVFAIPGSLSATNNEVLPISTTVQLVASEPQPRCDFHPFCKIVPSTNNFA